MGPKGTSTHEPHSSLQLLKTTPTQSKLPVWGGEPKRCTHHGHTPAPQTHAGSDLGRWKQPSSHSGCWQLGYCWPKLSSQSALSPKSQTEPREVKTGSRPRPALGCLGYKDPLQFRLHLQIRKERKQFVARGNKAIWGGGRQ